MNRFFVFLSFAAVSSASAVFLFNSESVNNGSDSLLSFLHLSHSDSISNLCFVHLVPKLSHLNDLKEFASTSSSSSSSSLASCSKSHSFLSLPGDELLSDLVALSDCSSWHVALLGVFKAGAFVHKAFAWVEGKDVKALGTGVDPLVGFLHGKLAKDHFKGLVAAGLPAHLLTHKLNVLFAQAKNG